MMTKNQASDLGSIVQRVKETALSLQIAQWAHEKAERDYDSFIWNLQYNQQPDPVEIDSGKKAG